MQDILEHLWQAVEESHTDDDAQEHLASIRKALVGRLLQGVSQQDILAVAVERAAFSPGGRDTAREVQALVEAARRGSRGVKSEPATYAAQHKFSSVQFNIADMGYARSQGNPAERIKAMAAKIPDSDLAEDGREEEAHVTVKYGFHTDDAEEIRRVVEDFGTVYLKLGKTSIFPAKEASSQRGGDQFDVVKIDVESEDLHRLNSLLSDSLEHTDTHPDYKPHITLAYVKPGRGKKYVGDDTVEGEEVFGARLIFSDQEGERTTIGLSPLGRESTNYAADWDEKLHPRDKGKFASVTGAKDDDEATSYEAHRAPVGGVTINGRKYPGGEFIPNDEVEKATPEEKAKLEKHEGEGGATVGKSSANDTRFNYEREVVHYDRYAKEWPGPGWVYAGTGKRGGKKWKHVSRKKERTDSWLAEHIADWFNLHEPDENDKEAAGAELQAEGMGYGVWWNEEEEEWQVADPDDDDIPDDAVIIYAAARAPVGGVTLNSIFYPGGRWIPSSEVEKASPAEKAKITKSANEHKERVRSRFATRDKVRGKVKPHADVELTSRDRKQARQMLAGLLSHHGDHVISRLDEIAEQTQSMLDELTDEHPNEVLEGQLKKRLAGIHMLVGVLEERGHGGEYEEEAKKESGKPKDSEAKGKSIVSKAQDAAAILGPARTEEIVGEGGLSGASTDALRRLIKEADNKGAKGDADAPRILLDGKYPYIQRPDGSWESEVNPEHVASEKSVQRWRDKGRVDAGFTGEDALGREWRDGELVAKVEEAKEAKVASLSDIAIGDMARVGGVMVRRTGDDEYRVEVEAGKRVSDAKQTAEERDAGVVRGSKADIEKHIESVGKQDKMYGKQRDAAIARADNYNEPSFMDSAGLEKARKGFEALPEGTAVVSLEDDTKGRVGLIKVDENGRKRVKFEGEDGWASSYVEPIEEKLSWRVERKAVEGPKQGNIFDQPVDAGEQKDEPPERKKEREYSDQDKSWREMERVHGEVIPDPAQASTKDLTLSRGYLGILIEDEQRRHKEGKTTAEQYDGLVDSLQRDAQHIDSILKDRINGRSAGPEDQSRAEKIAEKAAIENRSALSIAKEMGLTLDEFRDIRDEVSKNIEEYKKLEADTKKKPSPERQKAMDIARKRQAEEDAPEAAPVRDDHAEAIEQAKNTDKQFKGEGRYEAEVWKKLRDKNPDATLPKLTRQGAEYLADLYDADGKPVPPDVLKDYPDLASEAMPDDLTPLEGGFELSGTPDEKAADAATIKKFKDKPGVELLRAPAGGSTSEVNGEFYKGGRLMPIHGLSPKVEKKEGKGEGQGVASQPQTDEEKAKEREKWANRRNTPMTPEEIEEKRQAQERDRMWGEISNGVLGRVKWFGDRPNHKATSTSVTNLDDWKRLASEVGEDGMKKVVDALKSEYDAMIDASFAAEGTPPKPDDIAWEKNVPVLSAEDDTRMFGAKKHLKEVPSSFLARSYVQEMIHKSKGDIEKIHALEQKLNGIVGDKLKANSAARRDIDDAARPHGFISNRYDGTTASGKRVKAGEGFAKKNDSGKWETFSLEDVKASIGYKEKVAAPAEATASEPTSDTSPDDKPPPALPPGGEAASVAPDMTAPASLSTHDKFMDWMREGKATPEEVKANFARTIANKDSIVAELSKMSKEDLLRAGAGGWHGKTMKKGELVDSAFRNILQDHLAGQSLSYQMGEKIEDVYKRYVDKINEGHIADFAERVKKSRAERAARRQTISKAITNPETLDEFDTFIKAKGEDALSPEQRAKHDDLSASTRREKEKASREAKAQVAGVKVGESATGEKIGTKIEDAFHDKKNKPMHVVNMTTRVERDKFDELKNAAQKLGGYYSSFRGGRAKAGFQFETRDAAEKFAAIASGESVSTAEEMNARRDESKGNAADRIKEMAGRMRESAQESLTRDRKTNTSKRAGQAANAEAEARHQMAFADTMESVSSGIADGTVKHLDGVRAKAHLETLESLASQSKYNGVRKQAKQDPSSSHKMWEEASARSATIEDVEHAEYPYPKLWSDDLRRHAKELANVPGLKNVARKLESKAAEAGPKFRTQGEGFKFNGGQLLNAEQIKEGGVDLSHPADKMVRVHTSYDWRLAQQGQGHGPFYTADGGKSFGTSPVVAVSAAIRRGHDIDLVDGPKSELLTIDDPHDVATLEEAARKLRNHPNRNLQRIGEQLFDRSQDYNRLQAMDIKSQSELRAALREYIPLRGQKKAEDPIKKKERALIGRKIEGFFPTPRPLIERMLDAAGVESGMRVLEPSAGKGDIADAVKERSPESEIETVEPVGDLREILQMKGHNVVGNDILAHKGEYDRIVMNPPFENGQDMAHVRHAYDLLKPGGRLVAIVSEGPFGRQDKKSSDFRSWLAEVGGNSEELGQQFNASDAFRTTGVNTRMVVIEKNNDTTPPKSDEPDLDTPKDIPPSAPSASEATTTAASTPAPKAESATTNFSPGQPPLSVADLHDKITSVRNAPTAEAVAEIASHIRQLSPSDVKSLQKKLGVKVGGAKSKIADRLAKLATERVSQREQHVREARKKGIHPADLHAQARANREVHETHREQVAYALKLAQDNYAHHNNGSKLSHNLSQFRSGKQDYNELPSWDVVTRTVKNDNPSLFHGDDIDAMEQLFNMVAEGPPKRMSLDEAYEKAIEELEGGATPPTDDESVPFARYPREPGKNARDILALMLKHADNPAMLAELEEMLYEEEEEEPEAPAPYSRGARKRIREIDHDADGLIRRITEWEE